MHTWPCGTVWHAHYDCQEPNQVSCRAFFFYFLLTGPSDIVLACLVDQAICLSLTAPAHFIRSRALRQSLS